MSDDTPVAPDRPLTSDDDPDTKDALVTAQEAQETSERAENLAVKALKNQLDESDVREIIDQQVADIAADLERRAHHGKPERKRKVVISLYNEANHGENPKVSYGAEDVADVVDKSERTARSYMAEIADEYEGIRYRRPAASMGASTAKRLQMDYETFVENVPDDFW